MLCYVSIRVLILVYVQSRRGKRSKNASAIGVDVDGVCITYMRSQPPSARPLDNSDNVFIGAFPRGVNDLFEKVTRHVLAAPSFVTTLLQLLVSYNIVLALDYLVQHFAMFRKKTEN